MNYKSMILIAARLQDIYHYCDDLLNSTGMMNLVSLRDKLNAYETAYILSGEVSSEICREDSHPVIRHYIPDSISEEPENEAVMRKWTSTIFDWCKRISAEFGIDPATGELLTKAVN